MSEQTKIKEFLENWNNKTRSKARETEKFDGKFYSYCTNCKELNFLNYRSLCKNCA